MIMINKSVSVIAPVKKSVHVDHVTMNLEIMLKYKQLNFETSHESQKTESLLSSLSQGWSQSYDELHFSDYYKLSADFWQNDRIWRNFLSDKLYQKRCCNSTNAANLFLSQTWNGSVSYIFQNYNWKILENHSS